MDGTVLEFNAIKSFLNDLSAVSQVHYQIWDSEAGLAFSTQKSPADELTSPGHLQVVKKSVLNNTYTYSKAGPARFLCGLPVDLNPKRRGVLLAFGPVPAATVNGEHPARMKALLEQVLQLGRNGKRFDSDHGQQPPRPAEQSFEDLYLFANISKQFRSLRLKRPVLDRLMQRILDSMHADAAFIHFPRHAEYNQLALRSEVATRRVRSDFHRDQVEKVIAAGLALATGNFCSIDNSTQNERLAGLSGGPFKFMAVAVRHMKSRYGWLGLVSYDMKKGFRKDALTILQTLANQLAAMVANMEQYDELERFTVNIVCSLVNAIEAKDIFFRGHSKRVHQYVMHMAKHLQLPNTEREALKWAAVLHDIGKIGIPEKILCKPHKLTDKEFELIKQHPMKGKAILAPIRQLQPSLDAIVYHHERFDGGGYPEGLKGEAIPLAARILAVADTFDAITSKRSYHHAKSSRQALKELNQAAGTQLDPQLVAVFQTACQQILKDESDSIDF